MVKKAAHWNQSKSSPCLHYQSKTLLLLFLIICFIFSQLWLRIHPVCGGLLPRCPLTSTRPGCKNYEHRSDVQVSTSQSAVELFINCREVEVFTTAHVAVTHNCGVATPPPSSSFAPVIPLCPMRVFPWGQRNKWGSSDDWRDTEPRPHDETESWGFTSAVIPSDALLERESSAKMKSQRARAACMPFCCSAETNLVVGADFWNRRKEGRELQRADSRAAGSPDLWGVVRARCGKRFEAVQFAAFCVL